MQYPQKVKPGQPFQHNINGNILQLQVPPGIKPGMSFEVRLRQ